MKSVCYDFFGYACGGLAIRWMPKSLNKSIGLKVSVMKAEEMFDQAIEYGWIRDVFDRLITAEAEAPGFVLITKDEKIRTYYEKAVW